MARSLSHYRYEIAGLIDLMIDPAANSVPQLRAGNMKAYAVTSRHRTPAAPDVPTVDEAGGVADIKAAGMNQCEFCQPKFASKVIASSGRCCCARQSSRNSFPYRGRTARGSRCSASLWPWCFLGDAVRPVWVNGATRFHAIELRVDAPNLFYQPVNDRARGERPHSKDDNRRHGRSFLFSIIPLVVCQTYAGT